MHRPLAPRSAAGTRRRSRIGSAQVDLHAVNSSSIFRGLLAASLADLAGCGGGGEVGGGGLVEAVDNLGPCDHHDAVEKR